MESDGAKVIQIEGQNIPLIVVKRDGGFNYASTDMTALWYRLNEEKAQWIIYVTDVGQSLHLPYPKARQVGFGLVLDSDGK
ncbi:arginine--tRNA ligase domain-containing protein, partial [Actinobacillus pleuropneumoniae]|uniref:arginine--tRNA ligase domain-containing protein n=1 Tax=Actinobacillus pleuropneumoniae TaxID=715 RepID=UPI00227A5424